MRLWRFRRRKKKPELEDLASFISAIDGFRVGRCVELKNVDRMVRKIRLTDTSRKWKSVRRDLEAIMNLPTSSPKVMFLMNLALLLRFLGLVSFMIVMLLAVVTSFRLISGVESSAFQSTFISVLVFANVVLVIRYFVKERVKTFFDQSADRFRGKSAHLRELNQELIGRLREGIKKSKGNAKDYKLTLFNKDYSGIKVLKKPSAWREHYVAIVSTNNVP